MEKEMAIVIIGFDGYSDIWNDFFSLLNKYWKNRTFKTYLINNTLKIEYSNVICINCGENAEWSKKIQTAVENIEEEYICLLLEDFFIGKNIDDYEINKIVDFIKKEDILYYKLTNFSKINTKNYKNIKYLYELPANLKYGISLQAAIWNKRFLRKLVGSLNYNAWKFEADRLSDKDIVLEIERKKCIYDSRNILNINHGVVQGYYLPETYNYFKKQNYYLNLNKRQILSGKKLYNYRIKKIIYNNTPNKCRFFIKNLAEKIGFEFISTKHSK